jgi:hypothetical protein
VIEQPPHAAREAADLVEHAEVHADGLVVGGVQPERPAVFHQQPGCGLQVPRGVPGEFGAGLGEVLEVCRGPGQVLSGAVEPQPFIPVAGPHADDPAPQVI